MEREARGRRLSLLASLIRLEALRGLTQLLKEAVFGLLHAPGGCGIASSVLRYV
jgi:hypothetical protein